jgi:REP element-mobilizing transposase RayT
MYHYRRIKMKSGQLAFRFRTWGGKRRNAGRKPKGNNAGVSHTTRPSVSVHCPLHVTVRIAAGLPTLRQEALVRALRRALAKGKARFGLRVVHYSIQSNHVHCVVEASDRRALSRGMRGLDIRMARAVNRALGRRGRVIGDRYHARTLRTPREVRNVLAYVLLNWRHHTRSTVDGWDLASSAAVFDGWREGSPRGDVPRDVLEEIAATRVPPERWLLATGWRRRGLIDPMEMPAR